MPTIASSWLVGSITIPQQDFTIDDGGGADAVSLPAGTYYLRHATGGRSLISEFADAIDSSASAVNVDTTHIKRSRQYFLELDAPAAITWGGATQLRDLLGFTGNLASAATHLAPNISPLLWSPGYPATPKTIPGVSGYSKPHQSKSKSDDGTQVFTYHFGKETWQDLEWKHIVPSRLRVASGTGGGTFHEFYEQCAMLGARFFHYESVTEDAADSSTAVTWGTGLGPYVLRGDFDGDWYERHVKNADVSSPLKLPLQLLAEYP